MVGWDGNNSQVLCSRGTDAGFDFSQVLGDTAKNTYVKL